MEFEISELDKKNIESGVYSESDIETIVNFSDLKGRGMNREDKIFAKQFENKIGIVYIFKNKKTHTEFFENIGTINDYSDTESLYMTCLGSKKNAFYNNKNGITIIGSIE